MDRRDKKREIGKETQKVIKEAAKNFCSIMHINIDPKGVLGDEEETGFNIDVDDEEKDSDEAGEDEEKGSDEAEEGKKKITTMSGVYNLAIVNAISGLYSNYYFDEDEIKSNTFPKKALDKLYFDKINKDSADENQRSGSINSENNVGGDQKTKDKSSLTGEKGSSATENGTSKEEKGNNLEDEHRLPKSDEDCYIF